MNELMQRVPDMTDADLLLVKAKQTILRSQMIDLLIKQQELLLLVSIELRQRGLE